MKRQCAWCGLVLNQSQWSYEKRITHTNCAGCAEEMLHDFDMPVTECAEFLDEISGILCCRFGEAAAQASGGSR